ncbi:MAG: TlpA family protein disulfide reductase [Alcaligenaceae bacterium]|nr:TlpA family protein disulfide reductase [Alcaligenaceae bacterium]
MQVITLGPLSMNASLLFALLALMLMFFVAGYIGKKQQQNIESTLWWITLGAVLVGRLSFVARFWTDYRGDWVAIINLRDGGFMWQAALVFAVVLMMALVWRRPPLRHGVFRSVGAAVVTYGLLWGGFSLWAPSPAQQMPKIQLVDLENKAVSLVEYEGKPVVLNLWASWCPPCRREMPVLEAAQQSHPDLHFIFANQAETAQIVQQYLDTESLKLENVLLDKNTQLAELIQSRGLPTTLFIDAQGRIQSYRMGELSQATLNAYLSTLK